MEQDIFTNEFKPNDKIKKYNIEGFIFYCLLLILIITSGIMLKLGYIGDNAEKNDSITMELIDSYQNIDSVSMNFTEGDYGNVISVCFPDDIEMEDIMITSDLINKTVYIMLNRELLETADLIHMTADENYVKEILLQENDDYILLKINLDSYYAIDTRFSGNIISLSLMPFDKDKYNVLIAVESDNKLLSDIAENVIDIVNNNEINNGLIYVYKCECKSVDEIDEIIKASFADIYIGLDMADIIPGKDVNSYTLYNSEYFIPYSNSVTLADNLQKSIVAATNTGSDGLVECPEDDFILKNAVIPAAKVKIGYYYTPEGNINIYDSDYVQKAANGIAEAILNEKELGESK